MSEQVNIYDAKTQLSKLVDRAEAGEETIIARNGRPVARLVPLQRTQGERQLGSMRGKIRYSADYDTADAEIEKMCYGEQPDES